MKMCGQLVSRGSNMMNEGGIRKILEEAVSLNACPSAIIVDAMSAGPVLCKH
jgi:hypothetical protein